MNRCPTTLPSGDQCPWDALPGGDRCQFHAAPTAGSEQRTALSEQRRRIEENNRRIRELFAANHDESVRRDAEMKVQRRRARIDAWHARRRAEEQERRSRAAEAREAAQEAAQDPSTRQTCRDCRRSLPLGAFHRDRRATLGRKDQCRDCKAARDRARREAGR